MRSISYPKMFATKTKTGTVSDYDATLQNLKMLIFSEKGELFGDPYFGTGLKRFLYDPNDVVLQDLLIDELYIAIATFMPQILIKRSDITITSDGTTVMCTLKAINRVDFQTNLYVIPLIESDV